MNKLLRVLILLGIFLGLGISCASAANVVSFVPQTVELYPGSSQDVQIVMDSVPNGLSGFDVTLSISDPTIAEITAVSFPGWNSLPRKSTLPSSSVSIKAIDLDKKVGSGDTIIFLANITLTGKNVGTSDLIISKGYYDPDGAFTKHSTPFVNTGKINVLGKESPIIPVANLSSNVTSGIAPLTVQFNDTSTGWPTAWYWDFGDGGNSTLQNPAHSYLTAGNYTVNLTASNTNGTSSKLAAINVTDKPSGNNNLKSLTISSGVLSPLFTPGTKKYTVSVSNSVLSVTVTPAAADTNAKIAVNGIAVTSGMASQPVNLNVGKNTISIVVTAQNGSTKTYTITVTRKNK